MLRILRACASMACGPLPVRRWTAGSWISFTAPGLRVVRTVNPASFERLVDVVGHPGAFSGHVDVAEALGTFLAVPGHRRDRGAEEGVLSHAICLALVVDSLPGGGHADGAWQMSEMSTPFSRAR